MPFPRDSEPITAGGWGCIVVAIIAQVYAVAVWLLT